METGITGRQNSPDGFDEFGFLFDKFGLRVYYGFGINRI